MSAVPFSENQIPRANRRLSYLNDVKYDSSAGNLIIGEDAGVGLPDTSTGVILLGKEAGEAGADVKLESIGIGLLAGGLGLGDSTIAIGRSAGHGINAKDADHAVILGDRACTGLSGTYNDDCIVIGTNSGISGTGASSIAIGDTASAKGDRNISIGKNANLSSASTQSICIGENAGRGTTSGTLQGNDFICIGNEVGQAPDMKSKSISIGNKESNFGFSSATSDNGIGYGSIAIGPSCNGVANSTAKRGNLAVMIGAAAAYNGIGLHGVAIGTMAGHVNPPSDGSICIGYQAGLATSSAVKNKSISIGEQANAADSGLEATALGYQSHSQGDYSVSLGVRAVSAGVSGITVGAGARAEGVGSIGIGGRYNGGASYGTLGTKAVVIGDGTALNANVEENAVVIGASAALSGAGEDNVIIGSFANSANATDQAICINATGANLAAVASGLVIKPIVVGSNSVAGTIKKPSDTNFDHYLAYNATTGEIRAVLHGG